MSNFEIVFLNSPWLLLLLVPAVGFTLLSYFRLAKRYRKTRNRITSMVLHMLVMLFSVLTLSGMTFHYEVPNEENEILLVVDVSDTENVASEARDQFVKNVLSDGRYGNYKIGVVTFGFDQEYAVPLTYDVDRIYDTYTDAKLPDTSATNIASALEFAREQFKHPQSSKIVLITDGKQTDRAAEDVIRTITAQGTKIDVAHVPSAYEGVDAYVQSVEFPEYHVNKNEKCKIVVNIISNQAQTVDVDLYDNGERILTRQDVVLPVGPREVEFSHTFAETGLHEVSFAITSSEDVLASNDEYTAYYNIEIFNKLLIVERVENTSSALVELLGEDYDVTVKLASDASKETGMPKTVEELRQYDQVVLNNIANEDMPEGFDEILNSYVKDYGGGLFTAGGRKEESNGKLIANAYRESDMADSLYQQMLPVEAIQYTPPMGLVVIIDRSGSMDQKDNYGVSFLRWAKSTTLSCLNVLSERDYIGIMTLDDNQDVILQMTSRAQDTLIRDTIEEIDFDTADGGTVYPNTIERAGQMLRNETRVARKHIIMISDGGTSEDEVDICVDMLKNFNKDEITFSFIGVGMSVNDNNYNVMKKLTDAGKGNMIVASGSALLNAIQKELVGEKIASMKDKEFHPTIADLSSPLVQGLDRYVNEEGKEENKLSVALYGYHGVKARDEASVVLQGEFGVPIYAQWKYGEGTVGSLMCDVQNTEWSKDLMKDSNGIEFLRRVVNNLMPSKDVRKKDITYRLEENNYTNRLSVFANLEKGQTVKATIYDTQAGTVSQNSISMNEKTEAKQATLREASCYVTLALDRTNNYTRCDFVVKKSGVYKIVLQIVDEDGNPIVDQDGVTLNNTVVEFYKSFAYSEEYIPSSDEEEALARDLVATIVERANGSLVQDHDNPSEVYQGFVTALPESFDPRYLFMILALVCFLTDIAVRKFKFKWPHEIIREYKEKKKNSKKD